MTVFLSQASQRVLRLHLVSFLLALGSIPLGLECGPVFAGGAVALALVCFFHTRRLIRVPEAAQASSAPAGEELCQSEVFSSVDELAAGIAHEINNPLGIIAQEMEWLGHILRTSSFKYDPEISEVTDSLLEITYQVDRCKEIVQKLLSLARQMNPVVQQVDVNDLVRDMTRLLEREAAQKGIKIVTGLQPDLPIIYSDPPLMRQVLLNLMVNAAQATGPGDAIDVSTRSVGTDAIEISVHDTGCGIPKEDLARIFQPFFSSKSQGKGTGLGLALSRGIVQRLGGRIWVTSEPGRSTTFAIRMPLRWHPKQEKSNVGAARNPDRRR